MRRTLRLRDGEYEILDRGIAVAPDLRAESDRALGPIVAASLLRRSARDPVLARSLRLTLSDYMGEQGRHHRSDRDVLDEFARLLTTGRVALRPVRMRIVPAAWPAAESEAEPEPEESAPPPPTEELTWIEIVLVGEDHMPMVGEKCEIVGPDGARVGTYTTNSHGSVWLDQIEPGTYSRTSAAVGPARSPRSTRIRGLDIGAAHRGR